RREQKCDGCADFPPSTGHDHIAWEPRPQLLAIGDGLPRNGGWVGEMALEAHVRACAFGQKRCVVHVCLRCYIAVKALERWGGRMPDRWRHLRRGSRLDIA